MRRYGSKQVSKAHNRAALAMLLVQRPNLDSLDLAGLSRSYGLPVSEIDKMIAAERTRRKAA
jgi:hypothetical protein